MIEINDAGSARNRYEFALMQTKMPRQFWPSLVRTCEFAQLKVSGEEAVEEDTKAKTKKKAAPESLLDRYQHLSVILGTDKEDKPIKPNDLSVQSQNAAWENLVSLVHHWTPQGTNSPESGTSIVFFSPNLKHAQMCAMSLVHYMISKTFMLGERPYKAEVIRAHELWSRFNIGPDDAHTLPHVAVLPNIMAELTPTQSSMIAELLCSSYRLIAATNQTPQQFYDSYGVIPSHPFVLKAVKEVVPVVDFIKAVQGVK